MRARSTTRKHRIGLISKSAIISNTALGYGLLYLFFVSEKVIGYALCNTAKTPVYLRQFFICRNERRKGYGKQFFLLLLDRLAIREIDVDVYSWNDIGALFWESLGFQNDY
ncbi:MAG: GNAT family N-acetyltransferase [Clostridiales bacterium]|jgi:GNAT superfamily N-acetyltransferase|nr:GNAT family N-acetyltransferase [Clostridiales bacterium]